jgi:hypothetical protein
MSPRMPRSRGAGPAGIATRRAVMARDAGLRRISAVTRWLTAAAVAVSGGLALLAADAFHGRTLSNTAQTSGQTGVGQTSTSSTSSTTSNGLQPPAQAPAPAPTPAAPVVVSGGS